jgi:hypothetical protein
MRFFMYVNIHPYTYTCQSWSFPRDLEGFPLKAVERSGPSILSLQDALQDRLPNQPEVAEISLVPHG